MIFQTTLKTHFRENITEQFSELHNCINHNCPPTIMKIIAGKRKESHFVALCIDEKCNKISMESGSDVVNIWNKFNPA